MAYRDTSIPKLLRFFGITLAKPQSKYNPTGQVMLVPGQLDKNQKDGTLKPIDFPTDVMRAYEYFLQNQQLYNPNRERFELYKSLLFMVRNNGVMNRALTTYITETIEMKDGEKPIQIRAKDKKVEKDFNEWLDKIGFNYNMLNELVYDLVLLGDSFIIHDIDDEGIKEASLVDPFLVRDRVELNLNRIEEIRQWGIVNKNYVNRFRSIQQIIDQITNKKDSDEVDAYLYYKSYLLGYEMKFSTDNESGKDNYRSLPPWSMTHFRLFTTKSEFFPFGRPMFINSLAPFQSYKTTEMLIDMLRVAAFPKEIVTIKSGENATPFDRLQRINEVRELIENITPKTNNKDNLSINERYYAIEELFTYDVIDTNIDMDKLGDLEKKLDDLILSTGIPDTYLIPSRGSGLGGESAKALLYNSRIFKRNVEAIKSAILEGFSNMYRLHLTIANKFQGKDTEFELYMPINSEMFSSDKVSQDGDQLRLATDFLNNLGQALGMDRGQSLPPKVVKDILNYYLPVDELTVNKWINGIVKKEEDDAEEAIENAQLGIVDPNAVKKPYDGTPAPLVVPTEGVDTGINNNQGAFSKKISSKSKKESYNKAVKEFLESYTNDTEGSDQIIREAYFKSKKTLGMTNGLLGNYIYWNDSYSNYTLKEKNSIYNMVKKEKIGFKDSGNSLQD
jgi:hypothetical protein